MDKDTAPSTFTCEFLSCGCYRKPCTSPRKHLLEKLGSELHDRRHSNICLHSGTFFCVSIICFSHSMLLAEERVYMLDPHGQGAFLGVTFVIYFPTLFITADARSADTPTSTGSRIHL